MLSYHEVKGAPLYLSLEEKSLLYHIYTVRRRTFIAVYLFLAIVGFRAGLKIEGGSYRYTIRETGLTRMQMYWLSISLLETFVLGTGIFIYRKRVSCLKKDIKGGIKEPLYYTIVQKPEFKHTGQYFVGLNHPDYLFHEISAAQWQQLHIGDDFTIYRAPRSKYVFNDRQRYTII